MLSSSFFTRSSFSRVRVTAIAVAAFAFSGYVVFRAVPRRMVESLMYLPRQYGKDTFTSLLKERWHGWKVEFVPISLPRPTSSGGGAAVLPNSGRGFFFFSAADFWSANRLRKQGDQAAKLDVWLLYGGNAMVALEFLPFCIGVVEDHLNFRETPAPTNVAFVLADFPGYGTIVPDADVARSGESDYMLNSPNRDSIYASTKQVLQKVGDLAAEQGFDPVEDVNWHALGHSIGCAAILDYMAKSREEHAQASRHTGAAGEIFSDHAKKTGGQARTKFSVADIRWNKLICSAPFKNIPLMATRLLPALESLPNKLVHFLIPPEHRWDNVAAARKIFDPTSGPAASRNTTLESMTIHVIHGTDDEICLLEYGRDVHAAFLQGHNLQVQTQGAGWRSNLEGKSKIATSPPPPSLRIAEGFGHNDVVDGESFWFESIFFTGNPPSAAEIIARKNATQRIRAKETTKSNQVREEAEQTQSNA